MRSIRTTALLTAALLVVPFATANAQSYDDTGFYAKVGLNIGIPNIDYQKLFKNERPIPAIVIPFGDIDSSPGAGVGLAFAGGYRALPWLAGEVEIHGAWGGTAEASGIAGVPGFAFVRTEVDYSIFSFLLDGKVYPLGLVARDLLPENIQPYGLLGIGGGFVNTEVTKAFVNTGFATFGGVPLTLINKDQNQSGFFFRIGAGVDYFIDEHFGAYMDLGYNVSSNDAVEGFGIVQFGGIYRF